MQGQRVGYVESVADQKPGAAVGSGWRWTNCSKIKPGKDVDRPALEALPFVFVRQGDTVVVHSMDRLARNLDDLLRLVRTLTGRACVHWSSSGRADIYRRGFADGEPDALGDGRIRRIQARLIRESVA